MGMDEETLTALNGSIAKWQAIVEGTGEDNGPNNCPLCIKFLHAGGGQCVGCPVSEKTGIWGCEGTPYEAYADGPCDLELTLCEFKGSPEEIMLAQEEVNFLRSLLPSETA